MGSKPFEKGAAFDHGSGRVGGCVHRGKRNLIKLAGWRLSESVGKSENDFRLWRDRDKTRGSAEMPLKQGIQRQTESGGCAPRSFSIDYFAEIFLERGSHDDN